MPRLLSLLILFNLVLLLYSSSYAQNKNTIWPTGFSFDFSGDGKWEIEEGVNGKWVDELRFFAAMDFPKKFKIVAVDEVRFDQNTTTNNLTRLYLNYSNVFEFKKEQLLLPNYISINVKAGLLEWFPSLYDPRLVIENIDEYLNPESFYGGSIAVNMSIDKKNVLTARFDAHTGDLINDRVQPTIKDAYLLLNQPIVKNFGISAQAGEFQGSIHLVNHFFLYYKPKVEKMTFEFRVGKLPSLDQTPYGVHVGLKRPFNFIEIGGYYQRRLNQIGSKQIFGFTWRFLKPQKLVDIMNAYIFIYDTNTNTLRFILPFIAINVNL